MTQNFKIRLTGFLGILGGLVLFAGDMLFYYNGDETNLLQNMTTTADWRLILSGIFALIATWLYLFGLIPVYYAFKPTKPKVQHSVIILFAGILIAYGVVHGAYTGIVATAKIANDHQLDLMKTSHLAMQVNNAIRLLVYPLFAALSVIFIYQVWQQKTLYPKWMAFFFPLLPFILRYFIKDFFKGKWEVIIMGGYLNLILVVFFTASLIALWHYKKD